MDETAEARLALTLNESQIFSYLESRRYPASVQDIFLHFDGLFTKYTVAQAVKQLVRLRLVKKNHHKPLAGRWHLVYEVVERTAMDDNDPRAIDPDVRAVADNLRALIRIRDACRALGWRGEWHLCEGLLRELAVMVEGETLVDSEAHRAAAAILTPEQTKEDQIDIALTRRQSEMVRSLIYEAIKDSDDHHQREFLDELVDQFEQAED